MNFLTIEDAKGGKIWLIFYYGRMIGRVLK